MDDIDEYMDLPEDPELAFVEYVRRRQKEVQEGLREASYENSDVDEDDVRMKFVGKGDGVSQSP